MWPTKHEKINKKKVHAQRPQRGVLLAEGVLSVGVVVLVEGVLVAEGVLLVERVLSLEGVLLAEGVQGVV